MNWIFEGMLAALGQLVLFAGFLILAAGAIWSCEYLGINQGVGILSFYTSLIVSLNLFFAWKSRDIKAEIREKC
jgi:hypothetical protein